MTEYIDKVMFQRQLLAAEKYVNTVQDIHMHRLTSMWYETRPEDVEEGSVTDITYMDGRIERTLHNGEKVILVEGKKGQDLISNITTLLADKGEQLIYENW